VKFEACFSTQSHHNTARSALATRHKRSGYGRRFTMSRRRIDHGTHVASIATGIPLFTMASRAMQQSSPQGLLAHGANGTPRSKRPNRALQEVFNQKAKFKIASVNMSIGGGKYAGNCDATFPLMRDAIKKLRDAGLLR